MAVDPVPWMVENGAVHSTNVARNLSFAMVGGHEGIITPTACEVRELAVPGSSVRVYPGTLAIQNRAAGISDEMYVGRAASETTVSISATGGSPRSDMIVAQVENPWLAGEPWSDPPSNADGPYFFLRVISNVSSTAKTIADAGISGNSAIPLARIDIPASTSTITQAMITDLRALAVPLIQRAIYPLTPTANTNLTSSTETQWPVITQSVDIPVWATKVKILALVSEVVHFAPAAAGYLRVKLGSLVGPAVGYDLDLTTGAERHTFALSANLDVPASMRGTTQVLESRGWRISGTGYLDEWTASQLVFDVEFSGSPTSNV
jgi:hypothetical protein